MKPLSIVARIKSKPHCIAQVKEELIKLVIPTRAEQGCLNYDLHQDIEDPATFLFYENWTSAEDLDRHLRSPHITAYLTKADSLLEGWSLQKLTKIV